MELPATIDIKNFSRKVIKNAEKMLQIHFQGEKVKLVSSKEMKTSDLKGGIVQGQEGLGGEQDLVAAALGLEAENLKKRSYTQMTKVNMGGDPGVEQVDIQEGGRLHVNQNLVPNVNMTRQPGSMLITPNVQRLEQRPIVTPMTNLDFMNFNQNKKNFQAQILKPQTQTMFSSEVNMGAQNRFHPQLPMFNPNPSSNFHLNSINSLRNGNHYIQYGNHQPVLNSTNPQNSREISQMNLPQNIHHLRRPQTVFQINRPVVQDPESKQDSDKSKPPTQENQ